MAEESEKRTPVFEWIKDENGEYVGDFKLDPQGNIVTVTEQQAVEQIVIKAQQTARGVFLIYADLDNEELDHKYGNDAQDILTRPDLPEAVRIDELKRAVREAIIYDPWITDVYDIIISRDPDATVDQLEALNPLLQKKETPKGEKQYDAVYGRFKVSTIFDTEVVIQGVNLTNG